MNATSWGLAILFCFCQAQTDNSKSAQEPAAQALEHYAGVWDCNFTIQPQSKDDEAKRFTGVVTGKWVIGDKFLEQTGKYHLSDTSEPFVIKTMMSFARKQQRFQYDYFISSGDVQRSFGQWDAESKTMKSTMTDDGKVTTIVADFSTPDVERWKIESKDPTGKTITKITGTNTRRKEK